MKKKFKVNVHYDVVVPVEVFADSEDNVLDLAVDKASYMSLNDCDADYTGSCITDLVLTDEPLTPQKETLIDRIKAVLILGGTSQAPLDITKDDVAFYNLWASFDSCETEINYIDVQFSFGSNTYGCPIEEIPMDVLTEILKAVQNQVHNSK